MTIALHGGLSNELLYGISGGFIVTIIFLSIFHYRVYKSDYYNNEYVYFSTGKKIIMYVGFLVVNLCVAYLLFFIFTFVFAGLSTAFF